MKKIFQKTYPYDGTRLKWDRFYDYQLNENNLRKKYISPLKGQNRVVLSSQAQTDILLKRIEECWGGETINHNVVVPVFFILSAGGALLAKESMDLSWITTVLITVILFATVMWLDRYRQDNMQDLTECVRMKNFTVCAYEVQNKYFFCSKDRNYSDRFEFWLEVNQVKISVGESMYQKVKIGDTVYGVSIGEKNFFVLLLCQDDNQDVFYRKN